MVQTQRRHAEWINEWMNEQNKFICQAVQGFSRDREKLTHSKHLPSPGIRLKALPEFLITTHTTSWDRNCHYSHFADEEIELSDLPKPQGWNLSWPQNTLLPIGYTAYGSPVSSPHSPTHPPLILHPLRQPAFRAHPCLICGGMDCSVPSAQGVLSASIVGKLNLWLKWNGKPWVQSKEQGKENGSLVLASVTSLATFKVCWKSCGECRRIPQGAAWQISLGRASFLGVPWKCGEGLNFPGQRHDCSCLQGFVVFFTWWSLS